MENTTVANPVRVKRIIVWSVSIISILLLLSIILPFLVKPAALQALLSRQFRERTGFDIKLEQPSLSFLPLPTFRFRNIELRDPDHSQSAPFLTLEEFQCQLRILPLLLKQIDLSNVVFKNANIKWPVVLNADEPPKIMEFKNVTATLSNVRSNSWIKVELSANWLSNEPNFFLQGKAKFDFDHPDPASMSWNGQIKLKPTPLKKSLQELGIPASNFVDSGTVTWDGKLEKAAVSPEMTFQGVLSLDDLIYRLNDQKTKTSEKASYRLDLNAVYDLSRALLKFKPTTVTSSFMNLKLDGGVDLKSGKVEEIHVALDPVTWDRLPSYVLPLAELVPVNVGFSGSSRLDVVVSGSWNELALHVSGNFTEALFSYSHYFEKPKSIPLLLQSDHLVLKDKHILNGEVDITLNQAKLKGSFVKFDLTTGLGELTLMTNQFELAGWDQIVPVLTDYELSGALKIFFNLKNKTKAGEELPDAEPKLMYHVAFDGAGIREKEGNQLIEHLSGSIDAGPMDLEAKKFSFQIGDSHFTGQAAMFFQEIPRLVVNVESPDLDLRNLITKVAPIARLSGFELKPEQIEPLQKSIESVIKPNVKLENFSAELGYESKKVALKSLAFELYEGKCHANGWVDLNPEKPIYSLDVDIEKMSLARISEINLQSPIEGNLFLVAHAEGQGFTQEDIQTELIGDGAISMTNGEFKNLDLLGSMATVAQLVGLDALVSGTTRFEDMNSKFKIGGGKINTDQLVLYSDDLSINAAGDIDFQGNLNFRLQASLSNAVSKKINPLIGEDEQIGPIPLILTGVIGKPSVKPDAALMQTFIVNFAKQKFQKLFPTKSTEQITEDETGAKTDANQPKSPPAEFEDQASEKKSSSENVVQTGMALLESLLKKSE